MIQHVPLEPIPSPSRGSGRQGGAPFPPSMAQPSCSLPPDGSPIHPQIQPSPWDWQPATAAAAAWPVSLLQLQGPDSLRFLHGQSSQAIELASPGQWLSTCCISPTARMRALAEVLVSSDGAWLLLSSGDASSVHQALDRVLFPADAVQLGSPQTGLLLAPVPEWGAEPLQAGASRSWRPLEGAEGFWLGDQWLLLLDPATAMREDQDLEAPARALLARPRLTTLEQERWRLQCGLPLWPQELSDDTNPFELGLAPRVSLNKGCYVGQETLAKLATYDGVRRQLRRWWAQGPAERAAAFAPGTSLRQANGERAGTITSSLHLTAADIWIGLALVRRQALSQECLWSPVDAAADDQGIALQISRPPTFVEPPVGAGGG